MTKQITIRQATDWEEVRESAVGAGRAFPERSPSGPFFHERILNAPMLPLDNTVLLFTDGEVTSALQLYERQMLLDGHGVWAAAIGNVYTDPDHRGEGYGTELLEYTRDLIADKGYALSILKTDKQGFYSRVGWEPLTCSRSRVPDPEPIARGVRGRWEPFESDRHLEAVREIFGTETRGVSGRMRRPRSLWTEWILSPGKEVISEDQIHLFREDDRITGYLIRERNDDHVAVHEVGYRGPNTDTFVVASWNLLAEDTSDAIVWGPPPGPLRPRLSDSGQTVASEPRAETMIQLHDPDLVSSLVGPDVSTTEDLRELIEADDEWFWSPVDRF